MSGRRCSIRRGNRVAALLLFFAGAITAADTHAESPKPPTGRTTKVDFERQILPIFRARCFECHGPKEQEARLRLDVRRIVFSGGETGPAVTPGDSAGSLLIKRVLAKDEDERMPPEGKPLSADEIALVRAWIDAGAKWPKGVGATIAEKRHWAYVKPTRPALPTVKDTAWPQNAIDRFVLARLEAAGLSPSELASRARLVRRVYLDLIGLPPSPDEADKFVADDSPAAYERLVNRLLASPRYGERWARPWLDLARYADSNGFQADQYRSTWPYRDWVIEAMNDDMPFDQFTIEQLAGDLLPSATVSQRVATGFHRSTTCNVEAGVDPEENRVNQVVDRVNTTGTVWLGTTINCGQCHSHKYDPFTQRDYYRLFAYFNNTPLEVKLTSGVTYDFFGPKMNVPVSQDQSSRLAQIRRQHDTAGKQLKGAMAIATREQSNWEKQFAAKTAKPSAIARIVKLPPKKRSKKQRNQLRKFYLAQRPEIKLLRDKIAKLKKQIDAAAVPTTLVMVEMDKPRATHVMKRGNFLDKGERVEPGTPASLHPLSSELPPNRLGLAKWIVDANNPLTARVTVNRWWQEIFGRGIVATSEDFGTQCEPPTHPQLLDWLAVEFIEGGWSMKHVHKLIVMSATYRQSARVSTELLERDPLNKLLARGARFRLSAEAIRDNGLTISGLISTKMGGPPVFPPQPSGIWRHVGRNAPKYATSTGADRYRRGIYVIWRRSAPYPAFVNFDAPDRASCVVKRSQTNTPLQALTLLNDPAYMEMAVGLARRIATDKRDLSDRERVEYGYRLCVARRPNDKEAEHLLNVYQRELARFKTNAAAAKKLVGKEPLPKDISAEQLAAWVYVANILLNLDETITKG
ncbi:MAG: PSD1 domain-containing protein [Planctomycetes bacterium]|nr:PSD1 domain-containing protein [Planctomycetota bacterium]